MAKNNVGQWDTVSANNTDVGGINIAEGCPPSNVNDAMREMMAQLKTEHVGIYNTQEVRSFPLAGGLGNALTLTPDVPMTAYTDGDVVTWTASADNTAAAVLDVSSVGGKAIRKIVSGADAALDAKDMREGRLYAAVYDSSANSSAGGWILVNPSSLDTWSEQAAISIAAKLNTADLPTQSSVAKAWALVAANGSIAASYNVSSVTKNSTGRWTIGLGVTMANVNYVVVVGIVNANGRFALTNTYSTTGFRLDTTNNSDTYADPDYFSFAVYGVLA